MSQSDTPASLDELEKAIKLRMEAMYLSALQVRDLDNGGKLLEGTSLESALGYHLPAVMNLITESNRQARLDEHQKWLTKFQEKSDVAILNWSDDRIKQLQKPADKATNHEQPHTKGE